MVALPRKASGRTISSASPLAAIYSAAGGMWKRPTGFTAKIPSMSVIFIMALQTFCMLATEKAPPTPSTLHATPVLPETPLVASSTIAERDALSLISNLSRLAFSVGRYLARSEHCCGQQAQGINRNLTLTAGADGTLLGKYNWDLFYTHGENRLAMNNINNINNQRLLATQDAVLNSSGQAVCYATTPAAGAAVNAAYAGCLPLNPFGPGTIPTNVYNYLSGTSSWHQTNTIDDLGASIVGDVFELPAGPVRAALSGEARWMSFDTVTNAE